MATTVFLLSSAAETHRGDLSAALVGGSTTWLAMATSTARGGGLATSSRNTVTGPTAGLETVASSFSDEWISPPVDADVTISGTITGNIWAAENNMSANVAINFYVDKIAATDGALTRIATSARVTEVAVTTRAVNNFTVTPTSTALNKGDRLRVVVFGDDAGTMATGFSFNIGYNGTTASADGDTFITFNETFGFQTTDPTGSTLYLTDTASDVSTAAVDREMWTSRGGGVVNDVTNTASGAGSGIRITDTAGGTVVDWFSKQLQAFTLTGKAKTNLRANESNVAAQASLMVEIARVDADGSNRTVWGIGRLDAATGDQAGELATSEAARTAYVAGDDLAFTDGQRLNVRLYVDDCGSATLVTGHTITTYYNGTSGGASGDTFLTLEQTVAEFSAGPAVGPHFRRRQNANARSFDPWSLTGFHE